VARRWRRSRRYRACLTYHPKWRPVAASCSGWSPLPQWCRRVWHWHTTRDCRCGNYRRRVTRQPRRKARRHPPRKRPVEPSRGIVRKTLLLMLLLICRSAWPQVSDRAVVITHATVINPTSAYSQSDSTVVVIGERIVRVGSGKNLKVSEEP